jgi:hypothetical protein
VTSSEMTHMTIPWLTMMQRARLLNTGTIHGNTGCDLQFCAPRLPQGAVSGRVSAAARVRPACTGLSLGRIRLGGADGAHRQQGKLKFNCCGKKLGRLAMTPITIPHQKG